MAEAITVHCPACETAFPVDPDKVPAGGVDARCSECAEVFRVEEPPHPDTAEEEGTGLGVSEPEEPAFEAEEGLEAEEPEGVETGAEVGEAAGAVEAEEEPGSDEMELDTVDYFFGGGDEEDSDAGEEAGVGLEEPPEHEEEPADQPAGDSEFALDEEPAAASGAPETEAPEEEAADEVEAPPRPTFGQRTPEEKAERLARVLVSDMITYNAEMYEKARAQGTLKEDFEEEIEKSWEEYVEQVGEEMATSTSYWKDALNDILADGEEIF